MPKNIYFDKVAGNVVCAVAKGKKLVEYQFEKCNKTQIVGSIFKGRVCNVLPGMQAAFIDIGLERNGYLFVSDTLVDKAELEGAKPMPSVLDLKEGDEIMVQAVKDPIGSKGARLTTHLSFAGKYTVYVPDFEVNSVSRKITDENSREKLLKIISGLKRKSGGFVARTASENIKESVIKQEAKKLCEQYNEVLKAYETSSVGDILYSDGDLVMRILRDVDGADVHNIIVADEDIYNRIASLPKSRDAIKKKTQFFAEKVDLFEAYGLNEDIESLLRNRVNLESGAYLIIDKTEALTVIDVNTGGFVGENQLEDTVFKTNISAAQEIARQVRLRNIAGIVVVDFIDMQDEEHRNAVVDKLTEELSKDRIKSNVIGMTGLGLVEFTRQKKRKSISSKLNKPCPYCRGEGKILSNDYIVMKLRTGLLDAFNEDYSTVVVDLNGEICDFILKTGALDKDVEKFFKNKKIYLVPHKTYHQEFFIIKGSNDANLEVSEKATLLK